MARFRSSGSQPSLQSPPSPPSMRQFGWLSLVALVLVLTGLIFGLIAAWPVRTLAQTSQQVNFRISRLESDMRMLQSRINQLESQIGRSDRTPRPTIPDAESDLGEVSPSMQSSDPMFDRLATLVIEIRQDVFALEERLEALEQRSE